MGNQFDQKVDISFCIVEKKDCRKIWLWRNEEAVCKISFSSDPISYSQHKEWFKEKLQSKDVVFLNILVKNQDVGVLRYDLEGQTAEVHITIAPEIRNKGIGTQSLKMGSEYLFKMRKTGIILAHIKSNNTHSIRTFEKAGFIMSRKMDFKGSSTIEMVQYRSRDVYRKHYPRKIGAIIQTRMGSERLPGKSLMEVGGKPVLQHIIENQKKSKYLSYIILATTKLEEDTVLLELADKLGVYGFAGSENDVLARYKDAAEAFKLDIVVRVTGDNILTDVEGMDRTIDLYLKENTDLAVNGGEGGYPLGTAVEVFSTKLLKKLDKTVCSPEEREHVTLHIYRHQEKFNISYLKAPVDYRDLNIRLTIDTPEDLCMIRQLYGDLKEQNKNLKLPHVVEYLKNHHELKNINSRIKQKCF